MKHRVQLIGGGLMCLLGMGVGPPQMVLAAYEQPERLMASSDVQEQTINPVVQEPSKIGPAAGSASAGLTEPIQINLGFNVLYIPRGFTATEGGYDVVIHFHGIPQPVETALEQAHINAVLLVVNLGLMSGPYEKAFQDRGELDRVLAQVKSIVATQLPGQATHIRRFALSAWSAGYGAIAQILSSKELAERADAVLLGDGLHADYERSHGSKQISPLRLRSIVQFAMQAIAGKKLMAITHSAIPTSKYASTTETTDWLLQNIEVARNPFWSVRASGMLMTSYAERGGFHLQGFDGIDKAAHCRHLLRMGETLFPWLRERWASVPSNENEP